jgi:hypothetical protein
MTHAIRLKEDVLKTQDLLHYAAHRLATRSGIGVTLYDTVSLSDHGVAVIEGKISAAIGASESSAVEARRETPPQDG